MMCLLVPSGPRACIDTDWTELGVISTRPLELASGCSGCVVAHPTTAALPGNRPQRCRVLCICAAFFRAGMVYPDGVGSFEC